MLDEAQPAKEERAWSPFSILPAPWAVVAFALHLTLVAVESWNETTITIVLLFELRFTWINGRKKKSP